VGGVKGHPCTDTEALYSCTSHSGSRGIALIFMTTALEGGEVSASRPGHSLPPGKTRYPLYRRLGGSQGRSGQVRNISSPPGFFLMNHLLVLPFAVRYSCVFTMVLRVETYFHASRVQCVGGIGRWESGFRIGLFGAGGSVRVL